jgi:hypothetical protein
MCTPCLLVMNCVTVAQLLIALDLFGLYDPVVNDNILNVLPEALDKSSVQPVCISLIRASMRSTK